MGSSDPSGPIRCAPSGPILCIDPGSNLGFAVFEPVSENLLDFDVIKTDPRRNQLERLCQMEDAIQILMEGWKPSAVVVENVLVGAYKSKDARLWCVGTFSFVLVAATRRKIDVTMAPVTSVKKAVTGRGDAGKPLVIQKVNESMGLKLKRSEHNKADAVALGLYYFLTVKPQGLAA